MASRTVGNVIIDDTKLRVLIQKCPSRTIEILDTIAFDGERDLKQSYTSNSPSDPGEPPAVVTGALRSSVHTENTGRFSRAIVVGTEYAEALEYGTSKMAARPSVMPMTMRLQKRIHTYFADITD